MTELDDLATQFDEHEKEDARRFQELGALVRTEIGKVVEAIAGSAADEGLRSRIRKLEDIERDRKWALRILWGAVIVQAVTMLFDKFAAKGAP